MENRNGEIHIDDNEASAGETSGHMRKVLGISTLIAIIGLSIVWITGALTQGDVEEEATLSGKIQAQSDAEGDETDSIIVDDQIESEAEAN